MTYRDEIFDLIDDTDLNDSKDVMLTLKYLAEELCKYYGMCMRLPHMTDLYVRDKLSGRIHRIGFLAFASAKEEIKPIGYRDCSNAMMKMWMDNVLTDGEYNRIMDKLNAYWRKVK